jgi:hypothetical protein
MDPNGVQITRNFVGASFSTKQDLGAKEMQQGSHEGQTSMAHASRFLGHVGPARWHLVAPMPSIFVPMDSSWPKTDYIKGAPRVAKESAVETQKHETGAWEIKHWRGKFR